MRLPNWSSRAPVPDMSATLIGQWKRVRADPPDVDTGVAMEFTPDGQLRYVVDAGDREQIMLLTYRVDGNYLVTDQPSQPRAERTRFVFETPDLLMLDFEGGRTWFERASREGGT